MDRNPELLDRGAFTVRLPTAGWGEPADTWREGRGHRVRWGRDLRATVNSWAAPGATE